jgi:ubiquinone/menaquinone biosynthesis C-methylase UbiE
MGGMLIEHGYDYIGTDISEGMLEIIRKKFPGQQFYKQSVYDLSFPDKEFDGFWACAVLLHIPKKRIDEALRGIKAVVKPGAIGFISLKIGEGEGMRHDIVDGQELQRFYSYWSKDEFSKVLKKNNFELLDYTIRPYGDQRVWQCFFVKVVKDK